MPQKHLSGSLHTFLINVVLKTQALNNFDRNAVNLLNLDRNAVTFLNGHSLKRSEYFTTS